MMTFKKENLFAMKNKIILISIFLAVILTSIVSSCKKDDILDASDEELNREFMAIFRWKGNTGKSYDPLASQVVNTNDMYLTWNGINGCSGYRIQMKIQSGSWEIPGDILLDTILGPDVLKLTIPDLQYSTKHNFAIQTLSPKGEAYNSKWYGKGDTGHNDDRAEWEMGERLGVPEVMNALDVTETSMRVVFDLTVYDKDSTVLNPSFQYDENDKFLLDEITIQPASDNRDLPGQEIKLTQADIDRGYVDVTGLEANAMYVVNGLNNKVERYWDRLYNTVMVRMKGQIGEPILIPHIVDTTDVAVEYDASRLDTILNNYVTDNTLAEGTIFLLEAGKNYYLGANPVLAKGLVLKSEDPNNRAKVFMGLGWDENDPMQGNNNNFQLGRAAAPGEIGGIRVDDVILSDIDFSCPFAYSYFNHPPDKPNSRNYFVNQNSASMPFTCSKFEVKNCSFQGMIRGWMRTQGSSRQTIESIVIDNCLFHEIGMYSSDGRGYPFITGDAKSPTTNIFQNVIIRNNTFAGISYDHFLREQGNYDWAPYVSWHVTIENNTFLNAFSITNGRYLIELRYPPANSTFTIKKNLFILVKKPDDLRDLYQSGMDFYSYRPGMSFDIADNYSTASTSADGSVEYWTGDEVFSRDPLSGIVKGAGYNGGELNVGGLEATKVITGPTPIAPENLMIDPYPKGKKVTPTHWDSDCHEYNLDGLHYKNTDEVHNHPIYTKEIGDPRWR